MKRQPRTEIIVSCDYDYSIENAFEQNALFIKEAKKSNRLMLALASPALWLAVFITCLVYL